MAHPSGWAILMGLNLPRFAAVTGSSVACLAWSGGKRGSGARSGGRSRVIAALQSRAAKEASRKRTDRGKLLGCLSWGQAGIAVWTEW